MEAKCFITHSNCLVFNKNNEFDDLKLFVLNHEDSTEVMSLFQRADRDKPILSI